MEGNTYQIIRAIRGPITLITLGVLFALQNFTNLGFDKTWPVLLIVFGLLSLIRRGTEPSLQPASPPPVYYPPASAPPPPPASAPGSFRQSQYSEPAAPAAGASKGGFGTSDPRSTGPNSGDAV